MQWSNVKLIYFREVRDQLRDRRMLFTIAVLPLLLYPLLGMSFLQVSQFLKEHPTKIWVIGAAGLPSQPRLIDDDRFAEDVCPVAADRRLLELVVDPQPADADSVNGLTQLAEQQIESGEYDAVVFFPANFAEELDRFRARLRESRRQDQEHTQDAAASLPEPKIFFNTANDKSRIAYNRIARVLRKWREIIVQQSLAESNIPIVATRPFEIADTDIARPVRKRAALWSKILPFVVLIWALTGAFYPAVDLCAGEKERGTLETLLCSPAQRSEIVWGKLLTVMTFSMTTSLLNLLSMGVTGLLIVGQLKLPGTAAPALGAPPIASLGWLVLALIPISALFSALSLAVAAFARSSKEGQYYLMPLLLITLPLMMIPMLPAAQLDLGTSLIPVTGAMLLLRSLIEAQYAEAALYVLPVIAVTGTCCLLAIRWAKDQFNNESVLFRESERWDLGLWLRHVVRDRSETPTFGEAILCGVVLLVIHFFASLNASPLKSWEGIRNSVLVTQIAMIATPALLMTIMLTRSPRKTLLLRTPKLWALPAAVALAVLLHPTIRLLGEFIQWLYPMGQTTLEAIKPLEIALREQPLLSVVLLVALVPAICEELAFRGFILSGLRHMGHKWSAIVLSSIFFGVMHGILQQSLVSCVIGIVIAFIAVQTGSLLPGVLFHFTNNALAVLTGRMTPAALADYPLLSWIFRPVGQDHNQIEFHSYVAAIAFIVSIGLLYWFRRLPYKASDEERLQEALDHQTANEQVTPIK